MAKTSPTQRTIRALRERGMVCGIVERFNPHVGQFGIRQDLFGIIDIIALDPELGVVGIQSCGQAFSAHKDKILNERYQETYDWLSTPGTRLELWGWRKVKNKLKGGGYGKGYRWQPRLHVFTLQELLDHDADKQVASSDELPPKEKAPPAEPGTPVQYPLF